jgi:membrane protein DedA with SNARE-associated domain
VWERLSAVLLQFLQEHGDAATFLLYLLEEAGIPLPLPGDLVLVWTGFRIAQGESNFFVVLLLVELAILIGASTLFWLSANGGRPLLVRYGRFLHIDESKLRRAEQLVGRNPTLAIFLGRVVPGFRIVTPLAAGVFRVRYPLFVPALLVGGLVDNLIWIGVGFYFGPTVLATLQGPHLTLRLIMSLVTLVVLGLLTWQIHRRVLPGRRRAAFGISAERKVEAAWLAGLLATLEMATAICAFMIAFAELDLSIPERALMQAIGLVVAGYGTPLGRAFVPVASALFFLTGIAWAFAYARWFEPRLRGPDWLKGMVFSLLPTVVSWLVVLPALGAGPLGLGLQAGLVPAVGELLRHLIYGGALGLAYPMLLLARRPAPAANVPTLVPLPA